MNGYVCFYKSKQIDIYAMTSYAAQQEAQKQFQKMYGNRKVKGYEISVTLAEKDGKQVIHKPMM